MKKVIVFSFTSSKVVADWLAIALSTDRAPGGFSSGYLHLCEVCRRDSGHLHLCEAHRVFPGAPATTLRCNLGVYPLARRTGTQTHRSLLFLQAHGCSQYSARTLSNRHRYMQVIRETVNAPGCVTSVFHPPPRTPPAPPPHPPRTPPPHPPPPPFPHASQTKRRKTEANTRRLDARMATTTTATTATTAHAPCCCNDFCNLLLLLLMLLHCFRSLWITATSSATAAMLETAVVRRLKLREPRDK